MFELSHVNNTLKQIYCEESNYNLYDMIGLVFERMREELDKRYSGGFFDIKDYIF